MKVQLSDDGYALVRDDLRDITVGQRKRVMVAFDGAGGGEGMKSLAVADALIALIVLEWSLPFPIPAEDPSILDSLKIGDYDPLMNAALALQDQLFVGFDVSPDPKARTGDSSATGLS